MAQVPIEIIDLRRERTGLLNLVIENMNTSQDQYSFSVLDVSKSLELEFAVHDDTDIDIFIPSLIKRKIAWRGYHPFLICLFDTPINVDGVRNLFSVDIARDGFAAITMHNVSSVIIPENRISSYLMFQIAFFALKFSGGNINFHPEDRGCLFDYREKKAGIVDAIRRPYICDFCKKELEKSNGQVSPDFYSFKEHLVHCKLPRRERL